MTDDDGLYSGPLEVMGVSLAAAPPVGHLHVRLRPGVTAFYGPNGAGKTRILKALQQVLMDVAASRYSSMSSEANPPPTAAEALYGLGGVHLRRPLQAADWQQSVWSPGAVEEIVRYLGDYLFYRRSRQDPDYEARRAEISGNIASEVALLVQGILPWPAATIGEVEYLLGHGRWLVTRSPSRCVFLCDPDTERGALAERWSASDDLWRSRLDATPDRADRKVDRSEWNEPRANSYFSWGREPDGLDPAQWVHDRSDGEWNVPSWIRRLKGRADSEDPSPSLPPRPQILGLPHLPDWCAMPLVALPTPEEQPPFASPISETELTADRLSTSRLAEISARRNLLRPDLLLEEISEQANLLLAELFDDPPKIGVTLKGNGAWFRGELPVAWTANVNGVDTVPLERLGSAHRRYCSFSIQRAFRPTPEELGRASIKVSTYPVVSTAVIDEPERALHHLAVERLAAGLHSIATFVIVATHDADVLHNADHRLFVESDGAGYLSITEPTVALTQSTLKASSGTLGMSVSRLIAAADSILLVEGPHDVEVLRGFLAPELARNFVYILALGGTDGLSSIAEATYLFESTSAPIIVCLDSLQERVRTDLNQLKDASLTGRRHHLHNLRRDAAYRRREMSALLALFSAASEADRLERLEVYGMAKPDIVRYIDADLISGRQASWQELEAEFLATRTPPQPHFQANDGGIFKGWIGNGYKIPGIRAAVDAQVRRWNQDLGIEAHRHQDITGLAQLIDRLRRPGSDGRKVLGE